MEKLVYVVAFGFLAPFSLCLLMSKPRIGRVGRQFAQRVPYMLQHIRTMHGHYGTHQAAFAELSPQQFGAGFGPAWLAAISAGDNAEQGSSRMGQLMGETEAVQAAMGQARAGLQLLFYFVGLAFPGNAAHLAGYGQGQYGAARQNVLRLQGVLLQAVACALRDAPALAAVGYTLARREALAAISADLHTTSTSQSIKKGSNKEGTDRSTEVLNAAYAYARQVSAASKIIFREAATQRQLFRLGPGKGPQPERHTRSLKAPQQAKNMVFETPLANDTPLTLRLAGGAAAEVRVGRTSAPDVPPATWVVLGGAVRKVTLAAGALGAEGQYVVVEEVSGGALAVRIGVG